MVIKLHNKELTIRLYTQIHFSGSTLLRVVGITCVHENYVPVTHVNAGRTSTLIVVCLRRDAHTHIFAVGGGCDLTNISL